MFAVLFEIVSAYGTVGLSLGYTNINASLCSQFTVVGKLVIIAMMIRGRHRGLPYGLDRAILLPSESLNAKEAADANARAARRGSGVSVATKQGRGTSVNSRRRRSRSMDRVNSNIISSLFQAGPSTVLHEPTVLDAPKRANSDPGTDENTTEGARAVPREAETLATIQSS